MTTQTKKLIKIPMYISIQHASKEWTIDAIRIKMVLNILYVTSIKMVLDIHSNTERDIDVALYLINRNGIQIKFTHYHGIQTDNSNDNNKYYITMK